MQENLASKIGKTYLQMVLTIQAINLWKEFTLNCRLILVRSSLDSKPEGLGTNSQLDPILELWSWTIYLISHSFLYTMSIIALNSSSHRFVLCLNRLILLKSWYSVFLLKSMSGSTYPCKIKIHLRTLDESPTVGWSVHYFLNLVIHIVYFWITIIDYESQVFYCTNLEILEKE